MTSGFSRSPVAYRCGSPTIRSGDIRTRLLSRRPQIQHSVQIGMEADLHRVRAWRTGTPAGPRRTASGYSPDGTQLAYVLGAFRGNVSGGQASVSIVNVASGRARRLLPTFITARQPVWSPDGQSMLVIGRRDTAPLDQSFDWWWVPVDGGTPVRTGVLDLPGLRVAEAAPYAWTADGVFFSDGQNLRSVKLSPSTHRVNGPAGELTVGSGGYATPAVSPNGMIVFAAMSRERVIARAPLDVAALRTPVRVYADGQDGAYRASITADGTTVVMEQHVGGEWLIWRKNLGTGEQQLLGRLMSSDAVNPTIAAEDTRRLHRGRGVQRWRWVRARHGRWDATASVRAVCPLRISAR